MTHSNYLKYLIITFFVIFSIAIGFILLVDPYGLYQSQRIEGFNKQKPAAATRVRHIKPYQISNISPKTLILGNSRPEMGLDPAHQCWPDEMRPVYSLTLPGASIYRQVRYAQHAIATSNIKRIIIGVDFLDALISPEISSNPKKWPRRIAEFEKRLYVKADNTINESHNIEKYLFYIKSTISLQSLKDSFYTTFSQNKEGLTNRTELGFNPANNYYMYIIRNEGIEVLFRQKKQEINKRLLSKKWGIYHKNTNWSTYFESIAQLIKLAKNNNIQLTLFINPYHNSYLDIINKTGYQLKFEHWKETIKKLFRDNKEAELWDFSIQSKFTSESIQEVKRNKALNWFWEPAHYKKELGDLILSKITNNSCFSGLTNDEFGIQINKANL